MLCKQFGFAYLETAEDIASETFVAALESWPHRGIPDNPAAWLYTVAKNKARNLRQRDQLFSGKIAPRLSAGSGHRAEMELDWSDHNIRDSQLRMLFAVCHPALSAEAQICLSLRVLCGFGIEEIANALLTNKEVVNKRLYRAKEKLRSARIVLDFPAAEAVQNRLNTVLTTLYLLFNEGYYSESQEDVLREDLCLEAMRLTYLLLEGKTTTQPPVQALLALMCFHASRFEARKTESGEMVLYQDQDPTRWNRELIARGVHYLHLASQGTQLSRYHVEASIAYWHTIPEDSPEKWENILQLYNRLLQIQYSPVAALNRTFALAKANGVQVAIIEAERLQLTDNPFYFSLLGELYREIDRSKSRINFQKALDLAKTGADRQILQKKLAAL